MTNKTSHAFVFLVAGLVAGCSGSWETDFDKPLDGATTKNWNVQSVEVVVPSNLTVSEQNTLAPNADIVWHGEPLGDRRKQVASIMASGVGKGANQLTGARNIRLVVKLSEFHAVTPVALSRAPGAVHDIDYTIQAFDVRTGDQITEAVHTSADLEANVGVSAIIAAQDGQTQKRRIIDHVAAVTAGWLGIGPDPRRSFGGTGK